jgi:hypothetical protein
MGFVPITNMIRLVLARHYENEFSKNVLFFS